MRRLLDKLLNRFCVQTIRIPEKGVGLLVIQGRVTRKELAKLDATLETLSGLPAPCIGVWHVGNKDIKITFIGTGE